jgi:DNA-binding NarL/FixJ family response regulator
MPNINVLVIEDEPIIAQNIKKILNNMDFSVAGIAYNSTRALDMLASRNPDAVLLDITIKGDKDGIDLAEIINEKYKIPFIYLTAHSDEMTLERAKMTLPYGYIVKPFKEKDLLAGLEMAVYKHAQENKSPFPTREKLNEELLSPITEKEFDLLMDISEGLTNHQIAEKHGNSINTIKYHLKNLFQKMDVINRSSAIRMILNK